MKKEINVFMDDDARYCAIVGTTNKVEAEKALREQEEEWYGKNHEEKPIPFIDFGAMTFRVGEKNGETLYDWSDKNPSEVFDGGKFEKIDGFLAALS
jgi:hypothetical protein